MGAHTLWRARIAAALGEREQAVTLLRSACNEGQAYASWYHRNPDLVVLAEYPPFQELMRPKG